MLVAAHTALVRAGGVCVQCGVASALQLPCGHRYCEWCFVDAVLAGAGAAQCASCGAVTLRAATLRPGEKGPRFCNPIKEVDVGG